MIKLSRLNAGVCSTEVARYLCDHDTYERYRNKSAPRTVGHVHFRRYYTNNWAEINILHLQYESYQRHTGATYYELFNRATYKLTKT